MKTKSKLLVLAMAVSMAMLGAACAGKDKAAKGPDAKTDAKQETKTQEAAKNGHAQPGAPSGGIETAAVTENQPSEEELAQKRRAEEERNRVELERQRADAERQKQAETEQPEKLGWVHFDFDKSEIKQQDREILAKNAAAIKKNVQGTVVIQGHCDERGTAEYNLALGDRRASSVKKYLTSLGVDESRLNTVSYGEEKPLETAHNETAWAKNRRAQFSKE